MQQTSSNSSSLFSPGAFVVGRAGALVAALLGTGRGRLLDRGAAEVEVAVLSFCCCVVEGGGGRG